MRGNILEYRACRRDYALISRRNGQGIEFINAPVPWQREILDGCEVEPGWSVVDWDLMPVSLGTYRTDMLWASDACLHLSRPVKKLGLLWRTFPLCVLMSPVEVGSSIGKGALVFDFRGALGLFRPARDRECEIEFGMGCAVRRLGTVSGNDVVRFIGGTQCLGLDGSC